MAPVAQRALCATSKIVRLSGTSGRTSVEYLGVAQSAQEAQLALNIYSLHIYLALVLPLVPLLSASCVTCTNLYIVRDNGTSGTTSANI